MTVARAGLIAVAALVLSVAAAEAKSNTVTAEVNLRDTPTTSGKILTLIPKGTSVEVTACINGWCEVSYNGQNGYVISRNLDVPQQPQSPPRRVVRRPPPQVYADDGQVYDPGPVYVGPPPPYYYGYYGPYYGPRWGFGWGWGGGFRHRW